MALDLSNLAHAGVRALRPYEPGKPIDELERELGVSNIIKLASNENPLGPSAQAIAALQDELAELNLYPDGNAFNLKQALSRELNVEPAQLTIAMDRATYLISCCGHLSPRNTRSCLPNTPSQCTRS